MKIWVRSSQSIYGMSMELKKARKKFESLGEIIAEHVCKCILYRVDYKDYKYWIEVEIGDWLSYINDVEIATPRKRLKSSEYDSLLFGGLGNDRADARLNLEMTYRKCKKATPPYPDVIITDDMVGNLVNATAEIRSIVPKKLATKNSLTKEDFGIAIHQILDKYCQV